MDYNLDYNKHIKPITDYNTQVKQQININYNKIYSFCKHRKPYIFIEKNNINNKDEIVNTLKDLEYV